MADVVEGEHGIEILRSLREDFSAWFGRCSCGQYVPDSDSSLPGAALDRALDHVPSNENWVAVYVADPNGCRACPLDCRECYENESDCDCYEHADRHPDAGKTES